MNLKIAIAIDGPAGSGKSTIAKAVAEKFGYIYIDTGAMYRAITLKALTNSISLEDKPQLTRLAMETNIKLEYERVNQSSKLRVLMDGKDVSETIRGLEVTNNVSVVAAIAGVRIAMVKLQQQMASSGGVVMDGRDIGTVVLPMAELKIFLTASVAERSKRRWLELKEKGITVSLPELEEQICNRDYFDSHREVDPLCQAEEAILLDTTDLDIDQVIAGVVDLALQKGAVLI
jgi:CMP/dCMP kinase